MKKMIMIISALMAAFTVVAQVLIRPNFVSSEVDPDAITVTTNMVFCYEVTTARWEPRSCPDGIVGCAVQHMEKVESKQYIPVRLDDRVEVDGCDYVPIIVKGKCIWMHAADCRCLWEQHRKEKEERKRKARNGTAANT